MRLQIADLGGPVHYAEFGGGGEPMVLVHGLGGSLANWLTVAAALSERFRVFALDLAGFGHSPLAGRAVSVKANVDLVGRFLDRVVGGPAIVAGNSMGGLIAAMLGAMRPDVVSRLILVNAALSPPPGAPIDPLVTAVFAMYMMPFAGTLALRFHAATVTPERSVEDALRFCGADPAKVPPEVFEAHVALARDRLAMPWAHGAFLTAARSLIATTARRQRLEATLQAIRAPTLIIQGSRDRLVPLATAQRAARLRPDWTLAVLDGAGHVPQIEMPDRWLEAVRGWLGTRRAGG